MSFPRNLIDGRAGDVIELAVLTFGACGVAYVVVAVLLGALL